MAEQKYPPITALAMVSLGLIVTAGIYLSAHIPQHVPLAPAVVLVALSALVMVVNLISLTRVENFRWDRFFAVAKWSFLAYLTISGLIAYVFISNHTSGGTLVVLLLSLAIFSIHVPVLTGFTVARYADGGPAPAADGGTAPAPAVQAQ